MLPAAIFFSPSVTRVFQQRPRAAVSILLSSLGVCSNHRTELFASRIISASTSIGTLALGSANRRAQAAASIGRGNLSSASYQRPICRCASAASSAPELHSTFETYSTHTAFEQHGEHSRYSKKTRGTTSSIRRSWTPSAQACPSNRSSCWPRSYTSCC